MLLIILLQGFCPLKIKITQFPDGFRLNFMEKQLLVYLCPPPSPPWTLLGHSCHIV